MLSSYYPDQIKKFRIAINFSVLHMHKRSANKKLFQQIFRPHTQAILFSFWIEFRVCYVPQAVKVKIYVGVVKQHQNRIKYADGECFCFQIIPEVNATFQTATYKDFMHRT